MATEYTREWIQFFTGCGIPGDVATMYALIFYENRIQKNMLLDLNKEYLKDMGITVMGDVIAILRYAKTVHDKYVRERILSVDDVEPQPKSSPLVKKSTPMKRILEHYTRKYSSNETDSVSVSEVQVVLPSEEPVSKKNIVNVGMQPPFNKKIEITMKPSNFKEKTLEVPVPKVRRVLPENEGGYKIKMPSGTTERSKKLLEQAKKRKIKTVFDRLGESSVSSTTSEISVTTSSSSSGSFSKNSSVFSRLGEKTSAVSSTSSNDDFGSLPSDRLPYAGILKGGTSKKSFPNATMRADIELKSDVQAEAKKKIPVKKRLGMSNPNSEDEIIKPRKANNLKEGISLGTGTSFRAIKNKISTSIENKIKTVVETKSSKNFRAESVNPVVSTTTQVTTTGARSLKRQLDSTPATDPNPSKKVRFGKTTHRLIPSATGPSEPVNYVKNYPKLTMIISNRAENEKFPSGSLTSDKLKGKLTVRDRIGSKPVHGRLGKRLGAPISEGPSKKVARIQDRLG